jgi:vacuolar-type H+-ATPase subunit H
MREVIQKVIATETGAKQLVQAAQTEADQLLNSARMRARDLADQAHGEAKLETEKIIAAAEDEAAREKADRLADAAAEINTNIRLDAATAQPAVEAAVRCVCGFSLKENKSS